MFLWKLYGKIGFSVIIFQLIGNIFIVYINTSIVEDDDDDYGWYTNPKKRKM